MKRILFDTKVITFCNHGHGLVNRFILFFVHVYVFDGDFALLLGIRMLDRKRAYGWNVVHGNSWESQFMMSVIGNFMTKFLSGIKLDRAKSHEVLLGI